ncbi:MAG: FMN-binding protein [Treponema sp.]|jgi:uncharacterized protein with FMN-binding domain|nr:FMN-binding protein [Treponema sp.]
MMKRFLLVLLSLFCIISGCAILGGLKGIKARDGVFEGRGSGYRGPIHVLVRLSGGNIVEIEIIESDEDQLIGGEAIEELLGMVIEYNTTDIDVISGATESSRGFLEAVENAIMSL